MIQYSYLSEIDFYNFPVWNIEFDVLVYFNLNFIEYSRKKIQFKLGKTFSSSTSMFQSGELQKSSADR